MSFGDGGVTKQIYESASYAATARGSAAVTMLNAQDAFEIFVFSVRDGFVQVSAFVAVTVLLFSYLQYRTGGRIISLLEENERLQPLAGGLLGLTPGCGGAIVAMPLYIRGTVSFGTVVAALEPPLATRRSSSSRSRPKRPSMPTHWRSSPQSVSATRSISGGSVSVELTARSNSSAAP